MTKKAKDATEVTKDVNIVEMADPEFLSLVTLPANQVAFKVLREDKVTKAKKQRRSDKPLLAMEFPDDWSEEQVQEFADTYSLKDYSIEKSDGHLVLRSDTFTPEASKTAISVSLKDGVKAIIARTDVPEMAVAIAGLEFAADYYVERSEVIDWFNKNNVDISTNNFETTDEMHSVKRIELKPDAEVRRIKIDDGVVAVVARVDGSAEVTPAYQMPDEYVVVVNERAFGNYGWGQLDFSSKLIDVYFTQAAREGVDVLLRVIEDVIFWGSMTPAIKKVLIKNATESFSNYLGNLLDALPSQVIIANRMDNKKKDKTMSQEGKAAEQVVESVEVKREEVADVVTPVVEAVAEVKAEVTYITREDLQAALKEFMEKVVENTVKRSEPVVEAKVEEVSPADEGVAKVLRAVADLAEVQKGIADRITAIEGTTVVRSETSDAKTVAQKEPFKGVFGLR